MPSPAPALTLLSHEVPMHATCRRSFVLASLTPLLAVACASGLGAPSGRVDIRQNLYTPPCPQFELRESGNFTFDVTAAGDTIDLGDGSRIVFAPGAVAQDTRYWVRYLLQNGTSGPRLAGIDIERVSGHSGPFLEPVTVRLSYNKCGWTNSDRFYIVRTGPGAPTSEGGSKSVSGQWVEAIIGHFTGFAVAM